MSNSTDDNNPLLNVEGGNTPDEENKPKKSKKGKKQKIKDRLHRLSAGDISSIAPTDGATARNLEELTKPAEANSEESKKKDVEKVVTDQKAFDRKEQLKAAGIDEEAKHSFYDKVKQANDKYKKSGFGESVDRLGRNMKTVGQGVEGMSEQALLETALYNMLMLLFELLFGAKKGVKKLPEGVKWLNANRKREHLYSGALRRYAKEDHGKALKDADKLKKEIEDLKKERADLKKEKKEIEDKHSSGDFPEDVGKRYDEIKKRLKENKTEIGAKQEKYDAAMLKMAKAENTFKKHGDATKNEKWQKAMEEYKDILPKLKDASEKYKADKKIVDETPLLQRDAKRAELKLDQQKVGLEALKQKELDLYNKIEKLEKSIGKTSAELAEMQKAADKDHKEGMTKGRDRADKISQVEDLASQKIDSMKKGEGLANAKEALQKEQKAIKEAQAELKKTPDTNKTPEQKAEKAALDKRSAEIKGKLTNLDGKKATLDTAVNKAQAKMDNFTMLTQEQKDKKLQKDPNLETKLKEKLANAKENQTAYQKLGTDLNTRKEQLKAKIEAHPNLSKDDKKKTPERLEKLQNKFNRVEGQLDKYNAESKGQIAQNKQATDGIQNDIVKLSKDLDQQVKPPKATADIPVVEVTNPNPSPSVQPGVNPTPVSTGRPKRPQSSPANVGGGTGSEAVFSTSAVPSNPQASSSVVPSTTKPPKDLPTPPLQQAQGQPIFATSTEPSVPRPQTPDPRARKAQPPIPKPKPASASVNSLGAMVDKYAKMEHPVPQDQLMNRFQSLMIEGAARAQENSMREFLDKNPLFRPTMSNIDSTAQRTKSLEMIFAKAYLDHLKSQDSNIRTLTPEQAEQVKAIAKVAANDPKTTSMLKASAEQRVNAKVQALSTGTQPAELKPEGEKVNMAGDLAVTDKDKVKTDDKRKTGTSRTHQ